MEINWVWVAKVAESISDACMVFRDKHDLTDEVRLGKWYEMYCRKATVACESPQRNQLPVF